MERWRLELGDPIANAVSRVLFAPSSNNLLVSSWDSALRLYDVDASALRLRLSWRQRFLIAAFRMRRQLSRPAPMDACEGSANPLSIKTLDLDVASISVCGMCLFAAVGAAVHMYDLRNLTGLVGAKDSHMKYHISCIRSSPKWKGYATGSVDGYVALRYCDRKTDGEMGYVFRCHPKSRNGRSHLVSINDIGFHPYGNTFVTGDNDGYAIAWDAECRKKLFKFPRYPDSVASISYNHSGQLLTVASSYTYQEANEVVEAPQIFIERMQSARGSPSE